MSKQPDPSRSSMPRPGSVVPSSMSGSDEPTPIVPKLRTVSPIVRRGKQSSDPQPNAAPTPDSTATPAEKQKPTLTATSKPEPTPAPAQPVRRRPRTEIEVLENSLNELYELGEETSDVDDVDLKFFDRVEKNRNPLSSFLISTTIHVALFLTLAFLYYQVDLPTPRISIVAEIDSEPTPVEPNKVETPLIEIEVPNEEESPVEMNNDAAALEVKTDVAADVDTEAPSVVTDVVKPAPVDPNVTPVKAAILPTGGGLAGRSRATRAALAARRGGSRESELAVELGLKWIIEHQRDDGSWHFFHDDGRCNGQCTHQGQLEAVTAATGLALMSLLGAGYTHEVGQYQEEVQKGLDYLVKKMELTPRGGKLTSGKTNMYAHAIATIALSEALTMTADSALDNPVNEARRYIESMQHPQGGWRYLPNQRGDLSVTGWQLMALKSCEMAGHKTGDLTYESANEFVDSLSGGSRGYGYLKPAELPTMSAVGVLSKMYLGAEFDELALQTSTDLVVETGVSATDMYFNYYATQVLHHRSDPAWVDWNQKQRDYLIGTQDRRVGSHSEGSWHFLDRHGQVGGRLYTTAMAVMILEVYYRYMPLYDEEAVSAAHVNN